MSVALPRGLAEAVAREPGDDSLRHIAADWLEENGDADRAEFVRVQLELAAMGPARKQAKDVLKHVGGGHFLVTGGPNEDYVPGDRIDVHTLSAAGRDKVLHGLLFKKVVTHGRYRDDLYCVRDEKSVPDRPRTRKRLADRAAKLLAANYPRWLREDVPDDRVRGLFLSYSYQRGFIGRVRGTAAAWLAAGRKLVRTLPLGRVELYDRQPYHSMQQGSWHWFGTGNIMPCQSRLGAELFRVLLATAGTGMFGSEGEAVGALSEACLAWARGAKESQKGGRQ